MQYEYVDQASRFLHARATSDEARQLDSGIAPRKRRELLLEVDNPLVSAGQKVAC